MVQYILECIAFQLVFLIIYDFFLKRETFFQWNRLYLLGTHILSLLLPWIKIEALKTTVSVEYYVYPKFLWNMQTNPIELSASETSWIDISWQEGVFMLGILAASVLFAYKMWQLYRLRKKGEVHYFTEFTQIIVANSNLAFSFFKSIFLGDDVVQDEHENIIKHELVHIRQKHSFDLLFFELLRIVFWFNPLVYIYQNRISELHEFIADAQVAKTNKKEQYQLLLSQVFQSKHISFVNQFFKSSLIKKRIAMLQKSKSKKVWQLKYLLLFPIVMGMLFYTSLEGQETTTQENNKDQELIEKIREEVKKEIENSGSVMEMFSNKTLPAMIKSQNEILTKEDFFRRQILYQEMGKEINRKNNKGALKSNLKELDDPSTIIYNSYVNRTKAFQLIDKNLDISIDMRKYDVILIKQKDINANDSYVLKVVDIKDLTADEIRSFNRKMDDVFEKESTYDNIVLKDNTNVVRILKKVRNDDNLRSAIRDKNVEEKYNQLLKERERLLKNSNENNPIIENLDYQIRGLKQQISTNNDESVSFAVIENETVQEKAYKLSLVEKSPVHPDCESSNNQFEIRKCLSESITEHFKDNFDFTLLKNNDIKIDKRSVFTMFIIDKNGNISLSHVIPRVPNKKLEKEALRVVKLLPQMKPAIRKGKPVNVKYWVSIRISKGEIEIKGGSGPY